MTGLGFVVAGAGDGSWKPRRYKRWRIRYAKTNEEPVSYAAAAIMKNGPLSRAPSQ